MLPDTSLDQFATHVTRLNNANTASKYRLGAQKLRDFLAENGLNLDSIPRGVLTMFAEVLSAQGLAPASVQVMVAGARKYLKWLQDRGEIPPEANIAAPDLPKLRRDDEPNALRDEDLLEFFRWATKIPEPSRTAILLLPYCGLRSNELTTLPLTAVQRFNVPRADGGSVAHLCLRVLGKGNKVRTVPVLLDGQELLLRYMKNWRLRHSNDRWLFPAHEGGPVANRTIRHYVQWIREQMKKQGRDADRLTPHTLRRTYITTLWRAGLDVPTIIKISGHQNVQTAVKHYLAISPSDLANKVHGGNVTLIPQGPYADQVREAQANVGQFLDSFRDAADTEEEGS